MARALLMSSSTWQGSHQIESASSQLIFTINMQLHLLHLGGVSVEGRDDCWLDGRVEGRVDGRNDGWVDGWVDGRVGGLEKHEPIALEFLKMDGSL